MKLKEAKIVFMGTPFFAKEILENLLKSKIKIDLVVTQPDKLAGRRKIKKSSEVKILAKKYGLPLVQFEKLDSAAFEKIKSLAPDLVIVAAYGMIIPKSFLEIPHYGFINIHTSLLPKLRGASPIHTALIQDLKETGVTIMKIDERLDSGNIIDQKKVSIDEADKYSDLEKKLIDSANEILINSLNNYLKNQESIPQDHQEATFTKIIKKEDGKIDWNQDAENIWNNFRAFYNWPGSFTFWNKRGILKKLTLMEIELSQNPGENKRNGQVYQIGKKVFVKAGKHSILIKKIQLEGKNEMPIENFLNGNPDLVGAILK